MIETEQQQQQQLPTPPPPPPPPQSWFERLLSGSGLATVVVALLGQAMISIVYQIINNEQQAAAIALNAYNLQDFKIQVSDMRTPLSVHVFKLEDQFIQLLNQHGETNKRIEQMDNVGTRALLIVSNNQSRVMSQLDRFGDRLLMLDKRMGEGDVGSAGATAKLQNQIDLINQSVKRLDEQQTRIIQALDNTYDLVQQIARTMRSSENPKGDVANPQKPTLGPPLPRPRPQ